jgi:hypothetical protein
VAKRYFTVDAVNLLVPRLDDIFARVLRIRSQLKELYQRLEAKNLAPNGDEFDPVVPGAPEDAIRMRVTFKGLLECLKSDLADVESLGAEVKDLETGLVDFWARNAGRDVLLCWRYGEKACAWFHAPEAGFAGRRPISELRPVA